MAKCRHGHTCNCHFCSKSWPITSCGAKIHHHPPIRTLPRENGHLLYLIFGLHGNQHCITCCYYLYIWGGGLQEVGKYSQNMSVLLFVHCLTCLCYCLSIVSHVCVIVCPLSQMYVLLFVHCLKCLCYCLSIVSHVCVIVSPLFHTFVLLFVHFLTYLLLFVLRNEVCCRLPSSHCSKSKRKVQDTGTRTWSCKSLQILAFRKSKSAYYQLSTFSTLIIFFFDVNFVLSCLIQQTVAQQQQVLMLQNEMDKLRSDNVKLYEKIKFLQAYPTKGTAGSEEAEARYSGQYEERLDPFSSFGRKVCFQWGTCFKRKNTLRIIVIWQKSNF